MSEQQLLAFLKLRNFPMKAILFAITNAVLLGCATQPQPQAQPQAQSQSQAPSTGTREVAFTCDNGEAMRVRFGETPPQAVLMRTGGELVLPQQPSGSKFVYGNGRNTIRGKGDELIVEIGRMVPIRCTAAQ